MTNNSFKALITESGKEAIPVTEWRRLTPSESQKMSLMERFRHNIYKNPINGCWEWRALLNNGGYAMMSVYGRVTVISRFSYEYFIGDLPKGMLVCHKCDNPKCVNPFHLFLGTYKDNSADMVSKGRSPNKKGENNVRVKLNETQVREIIMSKETQAVLCKRYNVSLDHIYQIRKRRKWKHIEI